MKLPPMVGKVEGVGQRQVVKKGTWNESGHLHCGRGYEMDP